MACPETIAVDPAGKRVKCEETGRHYIHRHGDLRWFVQVWFLDGKVRSFA